MLFCVVLSVAGCTVRHVSTVFQTQGPATKRERELRQSARWRRARQRRGAPPTASTAAATGSRNFTITEGCSLESQKDDF